MRMTAEPICPIHKSQMAPATHWITVERRPFPKPVHVCTVSGCLYCYDDANAYHELPEDAPIGQPIARVRVL